MLTSRVGLIAVAGLAVVSVVGVSQLGSQAASPQATARPAMSGAAAAPGSTPSAQATPAVREEWDDPSIVHVGTERPHATMMAYPSAELAARATAPRRHGSGR